MNINKPTTIDRRKERFRNPQKAWKKLRAMLEAYEDQGYMKYHRVLGFGGFGIVQDWEILKPDGTRDHNIAIKALLDRPNRPSVDLLKREIWWHKRFTGCEHMVQLADLRPDIMHKFDINNENAIGVPIMAMEKMGRGSLHLLYKLLKYGELWNERIPDGPRMMEYIPNRCLWHIFLCLTRACISMAHPQPDALDRKGKRVREYLTNFAGIEGEESLIVHNDIDLQNIFIADPEDYRADSEHPWMPIVKIGDYGCMVEWNPFWDERQKRASLWGKPAYKAPEQFMPKAIGTPLGSWTNIYQIGQAMQDLVTLNIVKASDRSAEFRTMGGSRFSTFGWRVLEQDQYTITDDWKNVDIELRYLIAGCMAEDVDMRPNLSDLEELIVRRIGKLIRQSDEAQEAKDLDPASKSFVPGQAPPLTPDQQYYQKRVPMGEPEPDEVLQKFFHDFFLEEWDNPDKYDKFWADKTLSPYVSPKKPDDPDQQ